MADDPIDESRDPQDPHYKGGRVISPTSKTSGLHHTVMFAHGGGVINPNHGQYSKRRGYAGGGAVPAPDFDTSKGTSCTVAGSGAPGGPASGFPYCGSEEDLKNKQKYDASPQKQEDIKAQMKEVF